MSLNSTQTTLSTPGWYLPTVKAIYKLLLRLFPVAFSVSGTGLWSSHWPFWLYVKHSVLQKWKLDWLWQNSSFPDFLQSDLLVKLMFVESKLSEKYYGVFYNPKHAYFTVSNCNTYISLECEKLVGFNFNWFLKPSTCMFHDKEVYFVRY